MELKGQITSADAAMKYMLAGKAFVTFRSLASGNRYTYKIEQTDKRNPTDPDTYFVSLLNGPDNWTNYQYIGIIRNGEFRRTAKSRVSEDAPSLVGFKFCFHSLSKGSIVGFEVWHEGKCGRCGRKLTVPESVGTGFGPDCAEMMGAAVAAPVIVHAQGQRNTNFDGSAKVVSSAEHSILAAKHVAVSGTAAPVQNVGDIDAEIRRRIAEYQANYPEDYSHDGELDAKQAFNVAYNMFRTQIENERRA